MNGLLNYHSGCAAEDTVARSYDRLGAQVVQKRWRGAAGEIDIIAREGDCVVFVEVKKSKSFADAAQRLSARQMKRIYQTASEFLAMEPKGQNTEARFDVALVNGVGEVRILENAFGQM